MDRAMGLGDRALVLDRETLIDQTAAAGRSKASTSARVLPFQPARGISVQATVAANELAVRIDDAKPKVIVSATCGIEVNRVIPYLPLINGAIDLAKASMPERSADPSGWGAVPMAMKTTWA